MPLRHLPIRRKLMTIILLISGVVSVLTCAAFFIHDLLTFRQSLVAIYTIRSRIIATNSTAALAFENKADAAEVLSALQADPHVVAAGLYDRRGRLFARYPAGLPDRALPTRPDELGFHFERSHLVAFSPVTQGDLRLGTLYLRSDLKALTERFERYAVIIGLVMAVSFAVAYGLSRVLQKQVSQPILALADTARIVAGRRDYSVRATRQGNDELGHLTDAFNQMLAEIQALHADLERRVVERTAQLEAANLQLDRFFTLSLDFLCIAGADGFFKRASPAVTDILGWTVAEFLAMPYLDQVHPDDRAATVHEVERQLAAGEKVLNFENRYRHKDGSWRVLSWRSVPFEGLMYATARDVTEAKQSVERIRGLNEQLQRQAARLEAANAELEAFSYSVSHDLRAPLRHVQGYVEMLTREAGDGLSEKARRFLRTITAAAREMGVLIDDLLAFSRMGRTEMREGEVDLQRLAEEVRLGLGEAADGRTIDWRLAPLPRVRGDAALLRQVLVNLLGNAVKYTRRRDAAVIEFNCDGEDAGRRVFFVRDNGAGFDMRYADKLFGVFSRLHHADEFEGTGIGLASVRRIIARHGGRTWAEGRVGAGATLYFTLLPAAPAPSPPPTRPPHEPPPPPAGR